MLSAVGPLDVPVCLLVKIFWLTVSLISRFQDLGKLPDNVPLVYTLMMLMSTFVRLVVRGHALKKLLCLPRL